MRDALSAKASELGVTLEIEDSQNAQTIQFEQVDDYISRGAAALIINPVDRTAAGPMMDKARAVGIPIVFLGREPEEDVMEDYDKIWYVGHKYENMGKVAGDILAEHFKDHPEADKNSDGILQWVVIIGEPGHNTVEFFLIDAIKAIEDAGLRVKNVAKDTAMLDKVKAADLMKVWVVAHDLDGIEAVLSANDDMALGAIQVLKSEGYNLGDSQKYIPVVSADSPFEGGSDGILSPETAEAIKDGSLLGTVMADAANLANAAVAIAVAAARGETVSQSAIGYEITGQYTDYEGYEVWRSPIIRKYVWIPVIKVTAEN
jgi:methyl-galactoside transport system substrate-binding protein